jgi:hypothetical protein
MRDVLSPTATWPSRIPHRRAAVAAPPFPPLHRVALYTSPDSSPRGMRPANRPLFRGVAHLVLQTDTCLQLVAAATRAPPCTAGFALPRTPWSPAAVCGGREKIVAALGAAHQWEDVWKVEDEGHRRLSHNLGYAGELAGRAPERPMMVGVLQVLDLAVPCLWPSFSPFYVIASYRDHAATIVRQ